MTGALLIAGAGLGGLAAATAARRAGWSVQVLEQAEALSEVGAGIQLGPNASRILHDWGLLHGELGRRAARPQRLCVRDARGGQELGVMQLGRAFEHRYGAPYLTLHRADLQQALLQAAQSLDARMQTGARLVSLTQGDSSVQVRTAAGTAFAADALVGADGLWSRVREQVAGDGPPRATGHLAYRALARQAGLPAHLRSSEVTAWLGPQMHLVTYPVRGGDWLNVVCVVEGRIAGDPRDWDHDAAVADLHGFLLRSHAHVRELVMAIDPWRLWALHDRAPLRSARQMARGRVALLGDAAHPMLPYLAQGAGMAIEDALQLQQVLTQAAGRDALPAALQRYAQARWERCARVQRRSRRNATIFHADGALRWGRDLALRSLGERLLDLPWLYRPRLAGLP